MNRALSLLSAALVALAAACAPSSDAAPPAEAAAAPVHVDSAVPADEALRRFREGLAEPAGLTGGADSRDELVRRFVAAVEAQDSAALQAMVMDPAEYAYFYYPASPYSRPPTRMYPEVHWMLTQGESQKGIVRVLRRMGGQPLGFLSYRCADEPQELGEGRVWTGCAVRLAREGETAELALFGPILEHGGQFKFVSYANDF